MQQEKILVWLPSPMGDAIMSTASLMALRRHFKDAKIYFYANSTAQAVLSPCPFNDGWITQKSKNPFAAASQLRKYKFTHAILFKNSFASALTIFLAGIAKRVGYSRDGRGIFLNVKVEPEKNAVGSFKPVSAIEYYNRLTERLSAEKANTPILAVDTRDYESLKTKLPELFENVKPIFIIVPGGAFGPSKCWSADRYAQTADRLIERYNCRVVISVAPSVAEKKIAKQICNLSKNELINLGEKKLTLGELKALFSKAALVISNDTGPRHIAVALGKKIVTLFGPNNPLWTQSNYPDEIQIVADVPCSPCDKPVCRASRHYCMESITADMVTEAAKKLLNKRN